jgi:hypothetical protein
MGSDDTYEIARDVLDGMQALRFLLLLGQLIAILSTAGRFQAPTLLILQVHSSSINWFHLSPLALPCVAFWMPCGNRWIRRYVDKYLFLLGRLEQGCLRFGAYIKRQRTELTKWLCAVRCFLLVFLLCKNLPIGW